MRLKYKGFYEDGEENQERLVFQTIHGEEWSCFINGTGWKIERRDNGFYEELLEEHIKQQAQGIYKKGRRVV